MNKQHWKKRELYKLAVARSDVMAAFGASELAVKYVRSLGDPLHRPLLDSIIVNYSKPFSQNRPFGPLPGKWNKFTDQELQALHKEILAMRDTVIAHSDLRARKLAIHPKGPAPGLPGKVFFGVSITNSTMPVSELPKIRALCSDLAERLDSDFNSLLAELYDLSINAPPIELDFE